MTTQDPHLLIQSAPFLRRSLTTPQLMTEVIIGLGPVVLAAVYFFGISAILLLVAATAGAVATEWAFPPSGKRGRSLRDGSAILTGVILALTLPPGLPLWMAFLGGAIGVGVGKLVFGGLGQNNFNPALVGRAFLQAAFPTAMTTWAPHAGGEDLLTIQGASLALPMTSGSVDAVTTATPLGLMKFEGEQTPVTQLLMGQTAGSLGETCAIVIIICGVILAFRRAFDWRIPVSILLTVFLLSGVIWLIAPDEHPTPWFMVLSGGLLFGSVYMATDPVTSPIAPRGAWIFGFGIGALVVLIRIWGGLPEGVMYAILLMNAATPLIERFDQPRPFGRGGRPPHG